MLEVDMKKRRRSGSPFVNGVWGSATNNVFVVGDEGLMLHFDGRAWTAKPRNRKENYNAVWGHSGEVFVAGLTSSENGIIRHWDKKKWRLHRLKPAHTISGFWGSGPDNVFAVGSQSSIWHYDGKRWRSQPSGTKKFLNGVWGTSATNVFAVGESGTLLQYKGRSWTPLSSGTKSHLRAIWGSSSKDVFVAGDSGILHFDGHTWKLRSFGSRHYYNAIWGTGPKHVVAAGASGRKLRWDGKRWHLNATTRYVGSIRSARGHRHMLDGWSLLDFSGIWTHGPGKSIAVARGAILMSPGW